MSTNKIAKSSFSLPYRIIPEQESLTQNLIKLSQIEKFTAGVQPKFKLKQPARLIGLEEYLPDLQRSVSDIIENFGTRSYQSRFSEPSSPRGLCRYYQGLSLTYDASNEDVEDMHQAAFGKRRYGLNGIFFDRLGNPTSEGLEVYKSLTEKGKTDEAWEVLEKEGTESFTQFLLNFGLIDSEKKRKLDQQNFFKGSCERIKGSFSDNLAFRHFTEAGRYKELGSFLKKFTRSFARSRLAMIDSDSYEGTFMKDLSWHRDESIFLGLRINIPIQTNDQFQLEIEGHGTSYLDFGYAYTWDTALPHRVFPLERGVGQRIHLVLALVPWFDYVPENDCWIVNEFFGMKHPFDMINDGDFFPGLRFHPEDIV